MHTVKILKTPNNSNRKILRNVTGQKGSLSTNRSFLGIHFAMRLADEVVKFHVLLTNRGRKIFANDLNRALHEYRNHGSLSPHPWDAKTKTSQLLSRFPFPEREIKFKDENTLFMSLVYYQQLTSTCLQPTITIIKHLNFNTVSLKWLAKNHYFFIFSLPFSPVI